MVDNTKYTFSGQTGPEEGKPKDVDLDHDSPHHTLGRGPLQAAPGKHTHTASEIPDLPTGAAPHDHATVYAPISHNHPAITDADTVDGQHFNWDDRGAMPTYFWGINNYGDSYLIWLGRFDERYADEGHTHDYAAPDHGTHVSNGSTVLTTDGAGNVNLWLGFNFDGVPVICNGDFPAHPRAVSITAWNGVQGVIQLTNMNANQLVRVNWVVT